MRSRVLTKNFEAGTIYNLGTLSTYQVLGDFNNWTQGKNIMSLEVDYYVCKNIEVTENNTGFKFYYNDGSQYGLYIGRDANEGQEVVTSGNYYYANKGGGSNIVLNAGTYDLYLAKDLKTFLVMTAGEKYNANNWVIYGDSAINGIDKSWNDTSYIPMVMGGDGQYYLTITFSGDAYFKIFKIVNDNKWWRESNDNSADQVVTTTGTKCGDNSGSGKAFKITGTDGIETTKTIGFNDSNFIWLTE